MNLDLSNLAVVPTEAPKRTTAATAGPNPIEPHLAASKAETDTAKKGRRIVVPATDVKELVYLIRRAADKLGCGSSVKLSTAKGDALELVSVGGTKADGAKRSTGGKSIVRHKGTDKSFTGSVHVVFAAKDRREPKEETATDAAPEAASETVEA